MRIDKIMVREEYFVYMLWLFEGIRLSIVVTFANVSHPSLTHIAPPYTILHFLSASRSSSMRNLLPTHSFTVKIIQNRIEKEPFDHHSISEDVIPWN